MGTNVSTIKSKSYVVAKQFSSDADNDTSIILPNIFMLSTSKLLGLITVRTIPTTTKSNEYHNRTT